MAIHIIGEFELEELKEILKEAIRFQLDIDRGSMKELIFDLLDVKHQSIPGFLFPFDVFYFDKPQLAAANGLADPGNKVVLMNLRMTLNMWSVLQSFVVHELPKILMIRI